MKKTRSGYARTKFNLAKMIGISRNTLDRFLAMPGAPALEVGKGYDVAKVADFVARNATSQKTLAATDPTIRSLKAYELSLRCAKLRFHVERERGEYVLQSDVERTLCSASLQMRRALEQKLELEWPAAVVGLDLPEIRKKSAEFIDQIFAEFQTANRAWHGVHDANEASPLPDAPADL